MVARRFASSAASPSSSSSIIIAPTTPLPSSPTSGKYTWRTLHARRELFIHTSEQLHDFVAELERTTTPIAPTDDPTSSPPSSLTSVLGMDTEFLSFPYYRPLAQVLQLSTPHVLAAIDIVAVRAHLKPLLHLLRTREIVLHSSQFDLQILYDLAAQHNIPEHERLPVRIFDTQVAAAFVGLGNMIAYSKLIAHLFGEELDKSDTLTDWSKRPLTAKQIQYALNDVKHLHAVRETLRLEMQQLGRTAWFDDEMRTLAQPYFYRAPEAPNAWRSIFLAKKLDNASEELTILRDVAAWRELEGKKRDMSPGLLLRNEALYAIAMQKPVALDDLAGIQGIKPMTLRRHGAAILRVVDTARKQYRAFERKVVGGGGVSSTSASTSTSASATLDQLSPALRTELASMTLPPIHRLSHGDSGRLRVGLLSMMTSRVQALAAQHQIAPAYLASRQDLFDLASVSVDAVRAMQQLPASRWSPTRAPSNMMGLRSDALPLEFSSAPASAFDTLARAVQAVLARQQEAPVEQVAAMATATPHVAEEVAHVQDVAAATTTTTAATTTATTASTPQETDAATPLALARPSTNAYSLDEEVEMLLKLRVLSGWRRAMIGDDLIKIALGESLAWDAVSENAVFERAGGEDGEGADGAEENDGERESAATKTTTAKTTPAVNATTTTPAWLRYLQHSTGDVQGRVDRAIEMWAESLPVSSRSRILELLRLMAERVQVLQQQQEQDRHQAAAQEAGSEAKNRIQVDDGITLSEMDTVVRTIAGSRSMPERE